MQRRTLIASSACVLVSSLQLAASSLAASAPARARIATMHIPGDARFVAIARDVLLVQTEYAPEFASQSGLIDDAMHAPSFAPARVGELARRIRADLARLRALPWRQWDTDRQIDVRWVYANAARIERELTVEQLYRRRPAAWLESLAGNYIAILTYAPQRADALDAVTRQVPEMVAEIVALCRPTRQDIVVADGIIGGLLAMLEANHPRHADDAIAALEGYRSRMAAMKPARAYAVIGARNYAWRLKHAELLPWTPAELLAMAQKRNDAIVAEQAALAPRLPPEPPLSPELKSAAAKLDQAGLLALYDKIQSDARAEIERAGFVTIPPGVGRVRARVTPEPMVAITGDGGSMNPPPPFIDDSTGWWNVEHFNPAMPAAEREDTVKQAALYRDSWMGPYAVHEGMPGHHLQLSIARQIPNPIRNLFQDPVQNEGWALYSEEVMWEQGGLGPLPRARHNVLEGWRFRTRRVMYDVNVETAAWTLQQGADYKDEAAPGKGKIDAEVKRAINWPAQLICYFAGKEQILALKADYKQKLGAAYTERRFHDELLALGSVPYVFARAKMLGETVPGF